MGNTRFLFILTIIASCIHLTFIFTEQWNWAFGFLIYWLVAGIYVFLNPQQIPGIASLRCPECGVLLGCLVKCSACDDKDHLVTYDSNIGEAIECYSCEGTRRQFDQFACPLCEKEN